MEISQIKKWTKLNRNETVKSIFPLNPLQEQQQHNNELPIYDNFSLITMNDYENSVTLWDLVPSDGFCVALI